MEEFRNLATRYGDLYQSSFDADSATLRNVELYPFKILEFVHFPSHVDSTKLNNPLFYEDWQSDFEAVSNIKIRCQLLKTYLEINIAMLLFGIYEQIMTQKLQQHKTWDFHSSCSVFTKGVMTVGLLHKS